MSKKLPTIFARHKMGIGEKGMDWLYENDYIAIHYDDRPISANENEWKNKKDKNTAGNKLDRFRKFIDPPRRR